MGAAMDTIPSILNKCLFVSPDGQTHGRTDEQTDGHGQRSMPFRILRMAGA